MEAEKNKEELSNSLDLIKEFIVKAVNGSCKVDGNNIYLNNYYDYVYLTRNLNLALNNLDLKNIKIDKINFLQKKSIVITYLDGNNKEEYLKIFIENDIKEEIKYIIKTLIG